MRVQNARCESLDGRFARFWSKPPPRDAFERPAVEKKFHLGKTDTAPSLCVVLHAHRMQFFQRAPNQNRFRRVPENIDFIRVSDVPENIRRRTRGLLLSARDRGRGVSLPARTKADSAVAYTLR